MKNENIRKIINVDKTNYVPIYTFKQEDDGLLKLALYKNSTEFDITGQTVKMGAKRPNNSIVELTDGFKINKNELDITLKNNILAVPGTVECDLEIIDASGKMTTASFYLSVSQKMTGENNLNASNDISAINKLVEDIKKKGKDIDTVINDVKPKSDKLMSDIKKDYDSLHKIIIDENQAANLQDQVNQTNAHLEQKRDKSEKISQQDLDISSNSKKIQPYNLSDNVLSMITGQTPVANIIANKSVTPEKTTFFSLEHNNLNNSTLETIDYYINNENGELIAAEYYKVSDYIFVQQGSEYFVSHNWNMAFYDIDKRFVSGLVGNTWNNPLTIPTGVAYARFTFPRDADCFVYENENISEYYEYGNYDIKINDKKLEENLINMKKPLNSLDCFKTITNYFNINDIAGDNTAISDENGEVISVGGFIASNFIEVKGNENYCCTRNHHIAFYNKDKAFIQGLSGGTWSNPVTAPPNAYYVRITLDRTDTEGMFVAGNELPSQYYPYGHNLAFINEDYRKSFINALGLNASTSNSPLKGITWNVLGDSLTSVDFSHPNWWEIIRDKHGMIVNNYGISGTTMAHTDDRHLWDYGFTKLNANEIGYNPDDSSTWSTGNCMCERFVKMSDNADLITVMGVSNDETVPLGEWNSTDTTTTYGALNVLIKGLLNKYPDKKIAFFTPIQSLYTYDSNVENPAAELDKKMASDITSLQLKVEAIKRKCNQYSIPCLDLYNTCGVVGVGNRGSVMFRSGDGLHPSEEGNKFMATAIENFIMTLFN